MSKNFCFNSPCDIVKTGFRLDWYYVCRECKLEVTKEFAKKVEDRKGKKPDSQMGQWPDYDYGDATGE